VKPAPAEQLNIFASRAKYRVPPHKLPRVEGALGPEYSPALDKKRLEGQLADIIRCALGDRWWTLRELADATGHGEASISAQLRHAENLFGYVKSKRRRGDSGCWEYNLALGMNTCR
jgi:hypothetical protein